MSKKAMWLLFGLSVCVQVGCGTTPPGPNEETEPDATDDVSVPDFAAGEADSGEVDGFADVEWSDTDDATAVPDEDVDQPGPGATSEGILAAGLTWCLPEAVPYELSDLPPLPTGFDQDTFCEADTLAPELEQDPTYSHSFDPALGNLIVTAGTLLGPGDAIVDYTIDEAGHVRELYRQGQEGWYSVGVGETWYEFNDAGELTRKVATRGDLGDESEVLETVQVWEPIGGRDRLVSREVRSGEGGTALQRWTWEYDDSGRLLSVANWPDLANPDRVYEAHWDYHRDGTPASVERFVNDALVEVETWLFDEDQTVLERTFVSHSATDLVAVHGGELADWTYPRGLDTYDNAEDPYYMGDPWQNALPTALGSCHLPPRGPGHGYPDREVEYQLGVSRDERPVGIGFAYANDTYGWYYGDLAWYGHDGLGSNWYGQALRELDLSLNVTVLYQDGRMVSERGEMTAGDGATDGVSEIIERTRQLDESGRIVSDTLLSADSDDESDTRTLRFSRDDDGHLTERELSIGDTAVAAQTWERDGEGRVVHHAIGATEARVHSDSESWQRWFRGFWSGPMIATEYHWQYEGTRLIERSGGQNDLHEQWTYDEAGRPIESTGYFMSGDATGSKTWVYDQAGRVIENCNSYDAESWTCSSTVFDEAGRVAYRESWQTGADRVVIEFNEYTCTP